MLFHPPSESVTIPNSVAPGNWANNASIVGPSVRPSHHTLNMPSVVVNLRR